MPNNTIRIDKNTVCVTKYGKKIYMDNTIHFFLKHKQHISKFINNIEGNMYDKDNICTDINAFCFSETMEGYDFWNEINKEWKIWKETR